MFKYFPVVGRAQDPTQFLAVRPAQTVWDERFVQGEEMKSKQSQRSRRDVALSEEFP